MSKQIYTVVPSVPTAFHKVNASTLVGTRALASHPPAWHALCGPIKCVVSLSRAAVFQTEGGMVIMVMKARMMVFVIGIATAVLGCAANEVREDPFSRARGASYSSPASTSDSGGYHPGAITVNPGQVFEN